ncbi:hypothetical protein [Botrimarina sp.]|uniref:DNA polymerase III subunit n=1 Tax=Botrimarina sp. TaxID=2795802 RepID=UPI0032EC9FF5
MLSRVLGHDGAKDRFARTIAAGRLASTYLLVGPAGIGKRLFAGELAAALVCERDGPTTLEPCGRCDACQLSSAGAHPDVLAVARPEGRSSLPLELFIGPPDKRHREGLCHDLSLRPMRAGRRIAIIDDADDFGVETANALLKTLEEPPPRSLILLVGTSLARQLSTIRSRSQVVRFRPLADEQVEAALSALHGDLPPHEAQRLAQLAGGSVGRAAGLAEGDLVAACREVLSCLDSARTEPLRFAQTLEQQSKAAGTEPRLRRRQLHELLGAVARRLHERLLESSTDTPTADRLLEALDAVIDAEEALARNVNQSALVQRLAERLARCAA